MLLVAMTKLSNHKYYTMHLMLHIKVEVHSRTGHQYYQEYLKGKSI